MKLTVNSPDELIAAVPHILGFRPEESIVIVPMTPQAGLPCARADLASTHAGREEVLRTIREAYQRNASPGSQVVMVCITADKNVAEVASQHLADGLSDTGINANLRLWSDGQQWENLTTGAGGLHTQVAAESIAAATVLAGARQPASTREAVAQSFIGDHTPVSNLLQQSRQAAQSASNPIIEKQWAVDRLARFHNDGNRLSDADSARMLVALQHVPTRDALWEDMSRDNARSHSALWTDLTRRAPDEVRAAPAALAGFSLWLAGDGARAWCALDQVPGDEPYLLASIVAASLQHGVHPGEWDRATAEMRQLTDDLIADVDESYTPSSTPTGRLREPPLTSGGDLGARGPDDGGGRSRR
jgi:hypothetical protein